MSSTNPVKNGTREFLVDGTQAGRDSRTPSLVSFVGQTGAGKSTLIKLIIDLAPDGSEFFTTPVIGATGAHVPTSEDVHLYLDPRTADGSSPLLFADCEGLEGGEREPVGALFKKKRRSDKKPEGSMGGRISRAMKIISERELTWAENPSMRTREFAVTNLYPRLLYTFSDVIVFVLKNPRFVLERTSYASKY
jgi:energy-coupling factor transporter ATP-binding protein EcfA2